MGYDLHITRRKEWAGPGAAITLQEWLHVVRADHELRLEEEQGPGFAVWSGPSTLDCPWLDWSGGEVFSKSPDQALIAKMVELARVLDATVQGDDGESYPAGAVPGARKPSLTTRVSAWWRRTRQPPEGPAQQQPLPFQVGDRVLDPWGRLHTVVAIDPRAEHGLGRIVARRDDGMELRVAVVAHGLRKADET